MTKEDTIRVPGFRRKYGSLLTYMKSKEDTVRVPCLHPFKIHCLL